MDLGGVWSSLPSDASHSRAGGSAEATGADTPADLDVLASGSLRRGPGAKLTLHCWNAKYVHKVGNIDCIRRFKHKVRELSNDWIKDFRYDRDGRIDLRS